MRIDGSCHCGSITFTAEIDPGQVMLCHCTDCQTMSGAPFRHVVPAHVDSFSLSGTPKSYIKVAESGNRRAQMFCPECGTPLYGASPENPSWISIRLGCVQQRAALRPAAQIWTRSAMPWLGELDIVPGSTEQQAMNASAPR